MNEADDKVIDGAVGEYLRSELDPELGRAGRRFEREILSRKSASPAAPRRSSWIWAFAAGVVAASVITFWLAGYLQDESAAVKPFPVRTAPIAEKHEALSSRQPVALAPAEEESLSPDSIRVEEVWYRIFDEGTVVLDSHTPTRKLRCQEWNRVKWHDPGREVTVEMTVPREKIILVGLEAN